MFTFRKKNIIIIVKNKTTQSVYGAYKTTIYYDGTKSVFSRHGRVPAAHVDDKTLYYRMYIYIYII